MMNENEEDSKMKEKLTEEDWSKEELVKEDQKKEKLTEEDHKKETLSETHFLTHKSAIYQSHEDSVSKQIPSTKRFHVADIVPSCTLKKSPKEDFDSDITSHTSTFSPHKLASFSVLDNPSQHSSLISHSSLSESCRSSSTLPLTDSPFPQSLTSSLPPIQSLFTPSHSTITNILPEVEVPSSVIFDKVACIYTVQHNQVILTNKTREWIQCKLITTQILLDDNEV